MVVHLGTYDIEVDHLGGLNANDFGGDGDRSDLTESTGRDAVG